MTKTLTTSISIIAVLIITAFAGLTTTTTAEAQTTQTSCWDRWLSHYSSYSTTSNINNNAGYQGIELYNGDNKIMHWFSKKDTLHYFYTNGVEECDKNGAHRLNWVQVNNVWTKTTTAINFTPYTKQTSTRASTTNTGTTTQTQNTSCWDKWLAGYSSYPTTSNINNSAGYEGIELYNGSNKIMHWFSKKDTLHYYYTNGVQECDKNGGHRLNWVLVNGVWTRATTSVDFIPYTKQGGTLPTTEPTTSGTRPTTTNTNTGTTTGTIRTGTGTGTWDDGRKYTYKRYYRADGTTERIAYYRTDGSLEMLSYYNRANSKTAEKVEAYRTDGTIEGIGYYRTDGTLRTIVDYRTDGTIEIIKNYRTNRTLEHIGYYRADGKTIQEIRKYRADGTIETKGFYRADGTIETKGFYRADGTLDSINSYRADGTLKQVGFYRTDETLEMIAFYQANGETIKQTQFYRADETLERIVFANGVVWYYEADGTTRRNTGTTGTQSNNGLTIRTGTLKDGTPYKAYYRQDGTTARLESYNTDGGLEGVWLYYNDGRTTSRFTIYWHNGNIRSDTRYRQDGTTARLERYNSNGTLASDAFYRTDGTQDKVFYFRNGEVDYHTCYDSTGAREVRCT